MTVKLDDYDTDELEQIAWETEDLYQACKVIFEKGSIPYAMFLFYDGTVTESFLQLLYDKGYHVLAIDMGPPSETNPRLRAGDDVSLTISVTSTEGMDWGSD